MNEKPIMIALLAVLPLVASAEIYQWRDEHGQVHYSDQPTGESVQKVEPRSSAAPEGAAESRREQQQRLLRAWQEERVQKNEAKAQAREDREQRKKKCERAKTDLWNTEHARYIYEDKAPGERRIFDDAERAAYTERQRAAVKKWCGSS